jgi:hypothetical protein
MPNLTSFTKLENRAKVSKKQGFQNIGVARNTQIVMCQINPSGSVFVLYVLPRPNRELKNIL